MDYIKMRKELRNEIHFIEYPKDLAINNPYISKLINTIRCNNCNVILEKGEHINRWFDDIDQGRTFEQYCPFCYDKI